MKSVVFKLCSLEAFRRLPCREVAGPPSLLFYKYLPSTSCVQGPRETVESERQGLSQHRWCRHPRSALRGV